MEVSFAARTPAVRAVKRGGASGVRCVPTKRLTATARPWWPNLHDAWQDYPGDGRQSFHLVTTNLAEATIISKLPDAQPLAARGSFQGGDAFRTDLMHDAAQFLDPRAQPCQLFFADLVMF